MNGVVVEYKEIFSVLKECYALENATETVWAQALHRVFPQGVEGGEIITPDGNSTFMMALWTRHEHTAKRLWQGGCNVARVNDKNLTVFQSMIRDIAKEDWSGKWSVNRVAQMLRMFPHNPPQPIDELPLTLAQALWGMSLPMFGHDHHAQHQWDQDICLVWDYVFGGSFAPADVRLACAEEAKKIWLQNQAGGPLGLLRSKTWQHYAASLEQQMLAAVVQESCGNRPHCVPRKM